MMFEPTWFCNGINKLKPILLVQKSVKNSPSEDTVIELSENNTLDFTIYNESGYTHSYQYTFSDFEIPGAK